MLRTYYSIIKRKLWNVNLQKGQCVMSQQLIPLYNFL